MFSGCKALKELDLSMFDVRNAEHFFWMFSGCSSLRTLHLDYQKFALKADVGSDQACFYFVDNLSIIAPADVLPGSHADPIQNLRRDLTQKCGFEEGVNG